MEQLATISRIGLAGLAVWRLTRTVHASSYGPGVEGLSPPSGLVRVRTEDVPGSRIMDFLYWIGIWMSAQTTLWVVCGLTGVLLNWLAFAGIARVFERLLSRISNWSKEVPGKAAVCGTPLLVNAPAEEGRNGAAELCL